MLRRKLLAVFTLLFITFNSNADNIYIMNASGYNHAGAELISAITSNGHTVTENASNLNSLPAGFTTACLDPVNGYDYLCFFGTHDFSPLLPAIQTFIDNGGKVFYQYEVSCCVASATSAAAIMTGLTGMNITPNSNSYIALGSGGPGWESVGCCVTMTGNAYRCMDGLPLQNQLLATGGLNNSNPPYTTCEAFGVAFASTDFASGANQGGFIGFGDVNIWYDGGEPWANGGSNPINMAVVDYIFPAPGSTCSIYPGGGCTNQSLVPNTNGTGASVNLGPDLEICPGQTFTLDAGVQTSYTWQDNSTNQTFDVTGPGTYWVDVTNSCGSASDTVVVTAGILPTVNLGNDTTLCLSAMLLLDATYPNSTYLWQDASTNPTFNVTSAGTYTVDVTNSCGTVSDAINVSYNSSAVVNLGNDTTLCPGATLTLDAGNPGSTFLWQDNSTSQTFTVSAAGTYFVEVSDSCGSVSDTIIVSYGVVPTVNLGNDTTLCPGATLLLDATYAGATYLWQDNTTNPTYTVSSAGLYSVDVTNACGTVSDAINVTYDVLPTVNLGNDTTLCQGDNLLLDATFPASTYLWQDNSTNATLNVSAAGTYSVDVTNYCGTVSDAINITYITSPTVNLGPDTSLCTGSSYLIDATTPGVTYLWQDNSTNATYNASQTGTYFVTVTNQCGSFTDSINIDFNALFDIDLGNDTLLCEGQSMILTANIPNATTTWQDNTVGANYLVTDPGTYSATVNLGACIAQDTIVVSMVPPPIVDLGNDIMICEGDQIVLTPLDIQPGSYMWNTGSSEPMLAVTEFDTYTLSLTNSCGTDMDTIVVGDMGCNCVFYIPNTFTPDGDEFNQQFKVEYECTFYEYEFYVFNRWGERIFQSYDPDGIWDGTYNGKMVQSGTYTYVLRYKKDYQAAETTEQTGHITVIY
jgi:gliding motility-associated-like protein